VSDIPNRLATFANRVMSNFFAPNDGQWFPSTPENVTIASEGKISKTARMHGLTFRQTQLLTKMFTLE
jgi:hypothetical protein